MSSSMSRRECFQILGLLPDSSPEEIRQAYRTKAKDCHPDKNPDDPLATARFQRISQAYQILQRDFGDDRAADVSDNNEGGINFMDFFLRLFQRELLLEQLRRREAMRRRDPLYNLVFGASPFFSSRTSYYDDDSDDDDDYFVFDPLPFMCSDYSPHRRADNRDRYSERSQESSQDTSRRRYKQTPPQVHTPSRGRQKQSRPSSSYSSNDSYTPHRPRYQAWAEPLTTRSDRTSGASRSQAGASRSQAGASRSQAGASRSQAGASRSQAGASRSQAGASRRQARGSRDSPENNGANSGNHQDFSYRAFKTEKDKQDTRPKNESKPEVSESAPSKDEETTEGAAGQDTVGSDTAAAANGGESSNGSKDSSFGQKPRKAPAYVFTNPKTMTKKQLVAQQNRRQREANEIGKELLAKAEANMKLREEMKAKANSKDK